MVENDGGNRWSARWGNLGPPLTTAVLIPRDELPQPCEMLLGYTRASPTPVDTNFTFFMGV